MRSPFDLTWLVNWDYQSPRRPHHEATAFTVANGYFSTRGTHPESGDGFPAAVLAGIFANDRLGFRTLVNCADWLGVTLASGRKLLDPFGRDALGCSRQYDLRRGLVQRCLAWRPAPRMAVNVVTLHFASLAEPRLGLQRYVVTALDKPASITLAARVTTRVPTRGEYLLKNHRARAWRDGVRLTAQTSDEDYRLGLHALVRVTPEAASRLVARGSQATWTYTVRLRPHQTITLDKFVAFAADRDAGSDYAGAAEAAVEAAAECGFDEELRRHEQAWAELWEDAAIDIEGDDDNARALHFTTAQLLSHASRTDDRVGLAAKPLSAEGYRGHVFWDTDLFMTPAVTALRPDLGARLANYRWEMLPGARENAASWNYRGAWYPWESADEGTEVTPRYWLNTDGRRMPITCWKYEIHSVCDVAYAVWEYYLATGDRDWLFRRGAEILLETARFWASRVTHVAAKRRYEIHNVCGPDEIHEHTDNCAYVNVLAAWNIEHALKALAMLQSERPRDYRALCRSLGVTRGELGRLRQVARRMYIPRDRRTGWYRQFDGFEQLAFVDPQTVQERFPNVLDGERTQTVKQADVVMLLYLLRHRYTRAQMLANWDYYVPRTEHNTSLSAGTHAAVAARLGLEKTALRYFTEAANMDLKNWRGDTDRGLHGAAMGGAICAAVFGFGGVQYHEDHVSVDPFLPRGWQRLRIPFVYQGRRLLLDVQPEGFTLTFRAPGKPVEVVNAGVRTTVRVGAKLRGTLLPPAGAQR